VLRHHQHDEALMRALALLWVVFAHPARADGDAWPGEPRRFHLGAGYRALSGVMVQRDAPFLVLESQLFAAFDLRVGAQHTLRLQVGLNAGWPHAFGGETNLSFRFLLSPRVSLGVGAFGHWSLFALRGGLELPLSLRFGGRHVHELSLFARVGAGVFNNVTFAWWDFPRQYFALTVDGGLGYAFFL
jgi:hypothetical protein